MVEIFEELVQELKEYIKKEAPNYSDLILESDLNRMFGKAYNLGYDDGKEEGYDEGYEIGKDSGYSEGYDAGLEDGYQEVEYEV